MQKWGGGGGETLEREWPRNKLINGWLLAQLATIVVQKQLVPINR